MKSHCTRGFWKLYDNLPPRIKRAADKAYRQWRTDTRHHSLFFKPVEGRAKTWEARIDENYRAVCMKEGDAWIWYGIGDHDYFNALVRN